MGRAYDPARAMRERLSLLEAREKGRAEARAVADGVAETVALACARAAAAFGRSPAARRAASAKRPTGARPASTGSPARGGSRRRRRRRGEAYMAPAGGAPSAAPTIGSTLEVQPSGGLAAGPSLGQLLRQAAGRQRAEAELAGFRARPVRPVGPGERVRPRLRTGTGPRARPPAASATPPRLEAVLKVALDLLSLPATRR